MTDPLILFVESVCVQTAVYWEFDSADGYGSYNYKDPVEIDCRWGGKLQIVKNDKGEEKISKAEILVTQELVMNSRLYLGTLDDIDSDGDPPEDSWGIITATKTPLFQSATEFVHTVFV